VSTMGLGVTRCRVEAFGRKKYVKLTMKIVDDVDTLHAKRISLNDF
jgi:hypothetical protein